MEVIVPYDVTVPGMTALIPRFPDFRFLPLGAVHTSRPTCTASGQHELFDKRRAAGLAAASGDLVAILEDRGIPRSDWASRAVQLHSEHPYAAIGGAIENGRDRVLNWAVYFCDFARYQLPFDPGPRDYISDVNICYKRRVLMETASLWAERYHETTVHWALLRRGETLYLHPALIVSQMRGDLHLRHLVRERLDWGRLFAYTRAREMTRLRRMMFALLAPFLPVVLLGRIARHQLSKRRTLGKFATTWPLVLVLLTAWSLGESAGYLTAKP